MKTDTAKQITDKIISQLEAGVMPWVRPWSSTQAHGGFPYNAITGKRYRGINVALLYQPKFAAAGWMTYKQANAVGEKARKGKKGTAIVFWKQFAVTDKNAKPRDDGTQPLRNIPIMREFYVFNLEQIEG